MTGAVAKSPIRLFLLLENRLLREALARLFRKHADLLVIGSNGKEMCSPQRLTETACDVLVLDFFDARWLPVNLCLKNKDISALKFLLVGMCSDSEQFLAAVRGGVAGYLLKEASISEVVAAVRSTFSGVAVCPPELCRALFRYVSEAAHGVSTAYHAGRPNLTLRQQQLATLVAKGLTNKEIASRLNLSEYTIKNHIHRIMKQVDATNRSQAVQAIRSQGYSLTLAEPFLEELETTSTRMSGCRYAGPSGQREVS